MGELSDWQRVELLSRSGSRLVGCWHRAGGARGVILCHGMESSKEGDKSRALAARLAAAGCDVLRFDFSYVGESEGRFEDLTISGEVEDLAGAWQFMRRRIAGPLGIIGSSLGGTVALLFAAEQSDVAAVATIAAVASPGCRARSLPEVERARWRREGSYDLHGIRVGVPFLDDIERLEVLPRLGAIRCPVLLAHGTVDEVVPCSDATRIAAAIGGGVALEEYAGADHRFSDPQMRAAMLERIASWILEQLAAASPHVRP